MIEVTFHNCNGRLVRRTEINTVLVQDQYGPRGWHAYFAASRYSSHEGNQISERDALAHLRKVKAEGGTADELCPVDTSLLYEFDLEKAKLIEQGRFWV
jgi:hypothetical protein